jgi:hypothetical protein
MKGGIKESRVHLGIVDYEGLDSNLGFKANHQRYFAQSIEVKNQRHPLGGERSEQ